MRGGDDLADIAVPFTAVAFICFGMYIFNGLFFGQELVEDHFSDLSEPDGFLSTLDYVTDLLIGVMGLLFDIMSGGIPGAPLIVNVLLGACTAILAIGAVVLVVSLL